MEKRLENIFTDNYNEDNNLIILKEDGKSFTEWYQANIEAYNKIGLNMNNMIQYFAVSLKDNRLGMEKALAGDKEE